MILEKIERGVFIEPRDFNDNFEEEAKKLLNTVSGYERAQLYYELGMHARIVLEDNSAMESYFKKASELASSKKNHRIVGDIIRCRVTDNFDSIAGDLFKKKDTPKISNQKFAAELRKLKVAESHYMKIKDYNGVMLARLEVLNYYLRLKMLLLSRDPLKMQSPNNNKEMIKGLNQVHKAINEMLDSYDIGQAVADRARTMLIRLECLIPIL